MMPSRGLRNAALVASALALVIYLVCAQESKVKFKSTRVDLVTDVGSLSTQEIEEQLQVSSFLVPCKP